MVPCPTQPEAAQTLNIYGPYLGAGITVEHISNDWREAQVSMKLHWYNRNIVGVHFGGSLYSMADPHLMLMLMKLLGEDYIIWDRSATIDFMRPGRGKVTAAFTIDNHDLAMIKEQTKDGDRYCPEFKIRVVDEKGKTVAKITKVLYVRKKDGDSSGQQTRIQTQTR